MAIDTGARSGGRAASRIGPTHTSTRAPVTRRARNYQRTVGDSSQRVNLGNPRLTTAQRIASVPPKRKATLQAALSRVNKVLSSGPSTKGLDIPADIARLDVKFGHQFGIAPSVLAAQQRQESGFNPKAVSSAGAFGVSQFIPSTAASYGVKPGNVKSQVKGQAKYLTDLGFQKDPQKALSSYSGGYSAGSYNNPVLAGSKDYKQLDRPGKKPNPQDVHKLQKAGIAAGPDNQAKAPMVHASPQQVSRFKAVKQAASKLTSGHIPYVWGGGHGGFTTSGGLDCSGAVSAVLHSAGVLDHPLTSGDMGSALKPGPGAVTVYYNSGHTFMKIGDKYWGTSVGDSGSGGLGPHPNPSGSYLSQYNVGHVPGLGKQVATALGIRLTGGGGAVSSSSGGGGGSTTAHFGGGAVKGAPGFSDKPIKALSNRQKLSRLNSVLGSTPSPGNSSPLTASSLHGKPVV